MRILRLRKAGFFLLFLVLGYIQSAIAQDFTFTIEPDSLTLVPGQSASFVVSLIPFDGFTNEVALSVSNLPPGVTAYFSPQTLIPPETSLLTLSATTNVSNGTFALGLIATGGGITNMATSSVLVSIGLLPLCYGAFQGAVTDATTGLPVPYAEVSADGISTTANSNGQYLLTNIDLTPPNNTPEYWGVTAYQSNYYSSKAYGYAVCDATNTVNLAILLERPGNITGRLTSSVTGEPLSNVSVTALYQYSYIATTDTNGEFQFNSVSLGPDNSTVEYTITSDPEDYWQAATNTYVQANSNSVVNLVAVPVCYTEVTGSVVYGDTGLPATNLYVTIQTASPFSTFTDSNGNYAFINVTLDTYNAPVNAYVEASAPGYAVSYTNVELNSCTQGYTVVAAEGQGGGGRRSPPHRLSSFLCRLPPRTITVRLPATFMICRPVCPSPMPSSRPPSAAMRLQPAMASMQSAIF